MPLVKIVLNNEMEKGPANRRYFHKKKGVYVYSLTPKDGWWKVVWLRKPPGKHKDITGYMTKKEAGELMAAINRLRPATARRLVYQLHSSGRVMQHFYEMGNRGVRFHTTYPE